jgi:DNA-binding NarL/FixJ family response regulator
MKKTPVKRTPVKKTPVKRTPVKRVPVLLAEDHLIVREGLRALLDSEKDIVVVGEAGNGHEAVELTRKLCPAVVVMDIAMPLLNGMEATRQILRATPATKVIILSAHSDDAYVEHIMALGASGYLVKQTAAHVLPEAIRAIIKGETFFSPVISKRIKNQKTRALARSGPGKKSLARSGPGKKSNPIHLTSREMEVLQLIAEGKANKQTADELHISIKTVEKHRQSLMEKLNIHDTASLTRYAISSGVIENSVQETVG